MKTITINKAVQLEQGATIDALTIGFHTYGKLNDNKDNVIWVCHALTGNSDVFDWWGGLFGEGKLFDPSRYYIVCANVLGSCYGTTGPATPQVNKRPSLLDFPKITIKDIVSVHEILRSEMGIDKVRILIGASLGGQQALEWSLSQPELFEKIILIATNAVHSAFGRAFNASQRLALEADPTFGKSIKGGRNGLIAARSIALLSYRSYRGYEKTQMEFNDQLPEKEYRASGYQRYQGEKLAARFNAYAYYVLTEAMDSHNVGRGRSSVQNALSSIKAQTLVIGITSDMLFPLNEQYFLTQHIPDAQFAELESDYGHDGFLIETDQLEAIIRTFLDQQSNLIKPLINTRFRERATTLN